MRPPAEAFPPGDYLREELAARGWHPTDMQGRIISGQQAITPEVAADLAAALGTSAELWMNLESIYQGGH